MRKYIGKGTTFGALHSARHLHLIQQSVEIGPAVPHLNLVEVPGSNGYVDLTEAQGFISYGIRTHKWTFALYPGDDWPTRHSSVSNQLNGKRVHATLDDDKQWYYDGRLEVSDLKSDKQLRQIVITMHAMPHKLRHVETSLTREISVDPITVGLAIGEMPVIPVLTSNRPFSVAWRGVPHACDAGTYTIPALRMSGNQEITLASQSGTGTVTIVWREGSL